MKLPTLVLLAISAFAPLISFGQQLYKVTDLGDLGGNFTGAYGVNDSGEVTGFSLTGGDRVIHAFLYKDGLMQDLGSFLGPTGESVGFGINNRGWVTGESSGHAFIFARGEMKDLGTIGGQYSSGAAINDRGEVVGVASPAGDPGGLHAFLYDHGLMTDLGTLPGGTFSQGMGINSSGEIVGDADNAAGDTTAFLYRHGTLLSLGGPGGLQFGTLGINDKGDVVGSAQTSVDLFGYPSETAEAFIRRRDGQIRFLGLPTYGVESEGAAINNRGQVVGSAVLQYPVGDEHAVIYTDGRMTDLNQLIDPTLGITLVVATAISDNGYIVANGGIGCCGWYRAYLLTPIYPLGRK